MGLVDWWNSRRQEPVVSSTSSPSRALEGEVGLSTDNAHNTENADNAGDADNEDNAGDADNVDNADNASEPSQSQDVAEDQNEDQEQEAASEPEPEPKKGFFERFSLFKKNLPPEEEITPMESEDVFSPPRKKVIEIDKNSKMGKKSKYEENTPSVEDFVRVKVWLRRNRKEPFRPAKFCDCLVDYFAYADAKNIFSAPPIQLPGSTLNTPQSGGSLKDPSDKSSLHSSSEYLTWSGISTPFGCCSVNRSPLPSSTRSSSNHSCCLHSPKTEAISVTVECVLQDNRVLMQPAPEDAIVDRHEGKKRQAGLLPNSAHSFIAVLEHPPFCCAHRISPKDYAALPEEDKQRGVDVGLFAADFSEVVTRSPLHCAQLANQLLGANYGVFCHHDTRCGVTSHDLASVRGPQTPNWTCFAKDFSGCGNWTGQLYDIRALPLALPDTLIPCTVKTCTLDGWQDGGYKTPQKNCSSPFWCGSAGCIYKSPLQLTFCEAIQFCIDVGGVLFSADTLGELGNLPSSEVGSAGIWVHAASVNGTWMWLGNHRLVDESETDGSYTKNTPGCATIFSGAENKKYITSRNCGFSRKYPLCAMDSPCP